MAIRRKDPEYTQSMYGLLAILSQGPMSGYDVRKTLDDREMYYWRESSGNIYPMLRQLNQDGLLEKTDAYTKKKKRVLYSLTERGREELDTWLRQPAGLSRFRVELLMKLRFGTGLGLETLMSHLENYKHRIQEQLDEVREIMSEIDESGDSLESDMRRIAVMRFSLDMEAVSRWCDLSRGILLRRLTGRSTETRFIPWQTGSEEGARSYQGFYRADPWGVPMGIPTRSTLSLRSLCRASQSRTCP